MDKTWHFLCFCYLFTKQVKYGPVAINPTPNHFPTSDLFQLTIN